MKKAVFFGASTVEGAGASQPDKRFSSLVSQALDWQEINLGIGGTTVVGRDAEGQLVSQDSGLARVPDILDTVPDIVVILYGANDFGASVPGGTSDEFELGTFYWDFDTVLRGLLSALDPEKIILSTLLSRLDAATPNAAGLVLADYNRIIQLLGEKYGLRVLDPAKDVVIGVQHLADPVHLNDTGHALLADYFIKELRDSR